MPRNLSIAQGPLALLSQACMFVEAALLAEGRDPAWTVFRRHAID